MSPVFPFDIIALIVDIIGENKDTNLLKELALVSHSFLQICSKHLYSFVELHDANPRGGVASSKKGFVKLLESRRDVVKYIRTLNYFVGYEDYDRQLPPILPNLLRTIPRLNFLTIKAYRDWNTLDSSLKSALLHLMHLPTVNRIHLLSIQNFPLSSLAPSVNLLQLVILHMSCSNPLEGSPEIVVEMMPKIREFYTTGSTLLTTKLLHAKRQDGQQAFHFMDLTRLRISLQGSEDERNIRHLLQNAKLLENLHLSLNHGRSLVGLLSPIAPTLKVLHLSVSLFHKMSSTFLGGLCEELEALVGHNKLEALSFGIFVLSLETEDFIGCLLQKVEKVLVKSGWSALRDVSIEVTLAPFGNPNVGRRAKLFKALQSLPNGYLSHLSKLESVTFNYSVSSSLLQ
jgi:hypothetical protein